MSLRALSVPVAVLCSAPALFAQSNACSSATPITGPGVYSGTTVGASNDGSASCGNSLTSPDVWFSVTPSSTRLLVVSLCAGATWDTVLSLHPACPGNRFNQITCNDDACGIRSRIEAPIIAGNTYYIRVAGFNGATGPFAFNVSYDDVSFPGPDVIVGDIQSMVRYPGEDGVAAFAIGATSCNVGTEDADWFAGTADHPVVAQSFYRLRNRRLEQVGISWVKHTFGTIDDAICGVCNGHLGQILGVGCSDPYDAGTNGAQAILGPRWQINPTTGEYPYPFANPSYTGNIARRLQVLSSDIDPAQNAGARYFAEVQYISTDDAPAGNGLNNASSREISFPNATGLPEFVGDTRRRAPAIRAWREVDPAVVLVNADYLEGNLTARFIVAARVNNLGATWAYEYAVFNLNSDRAARAFEVPMPASGSVSNVGFHDVFYHSNDGVNSITFDGTDWVNVQAGGMVRWETQTFIQNQNANAIRWGTLYNFRFTTNEPPVTGDAVLTLFKPGAEGDPITVTAVGLPVPNGVPPCAADWNDNGVLNSQDFFEFLRDFFLNLADFNSDGYVNSQDLFDYIRAFYAGC